MNISFIITRALQKIKFVLVLNLISCAYSNVGLCSDRNISDVVAVRIGTPIELTVGQAFFVDIAARPIAGYRLARAFKSSMPGSFGLPFTFAIDSDLLLKAGQNGAGWEFFIPMDHKFRAYHSLLGSVIRGHDAVGLRVGPQGQKEWFVDNSTYARTPTIWTRPVRPDDPALSRIALEAKVVNRDPVERLIYDGMTARKRAKIIQEQVSLHGTRHHEFTFPLDKDGKGQGIVNGVEFVMIANPTRAIITVIKADLSNQGVPLPEGNSDPARKPDTPDPNHIATRRANTSPATAS